MSIYITSPEIYRILNSNNSLININYRHSITALESIIHQVRKNFLSDKKTLIVIPDTEARQMLLEILKKSNLNHTTLSVNLEDTPSRFALGINNKHTFKSECQPTHWGDPANRLKRELDTLILKIHNKYQVTSSEKSWIKMVDDYCKLQVSIEVLLLNRWLDSSFQNMNQEGLQGLLDLITEAQNYYHPEFEIKDYSLLNHELNKNIAEHSRLKSTIHVMSQLLDQSEVLKNDYLKYSQELENDFLKKKLSTTEQLRNKNAQLRSDITQWISVQHQLNKSILPGFLSEKQKNHTQKGKSLLNELETFLANVRELTHIHLYTPNKLTISIVQTFSDIETALDDNMSTLISMKNEYMKSVNIHNHLNPTLEKLETNLKSLVDTINEAGFLNDVLEINTLSFAKQTDIIISLQRKLHLLRSEAEHSMYYLEWKQFFRQKSETDQKVLHALRNINPEKWYDSIYGWYLYHNITKDYIHLQSITQEQIVDLQELFILNEDNITSCKIKEHVTNTEDSIKQYRKSDEDLYNFFTSEKGNSKYSNWTQLLDNHYDQLEDIFPVIITDDDSLFKLKHSDNRNLIVFNKEPNLNIMQLFNSSTYYWDESHMIQNPDFVLHLTSHTRDFRQMKPTDLLPVFRNLALTILSADVMPEVYLLKDMCIFSFASDYINNKLTDTLHNYGIKRVLPNPTFEKALTGAFLEANNNIICIIEDALPDPGNTENIYWQTQILNIIQNTGIQILNIDSSVLFSNENIIDEIILNIASEQQYHSKQVKSQLTIEFT
ncbi:MAG TPA: hypothetical protein PK047_04635 [Saprospiraceae bacterium]|nr:hypothetical protein [Saprospiraceae bacterium]HRO08130.1 hypothetical protein [Saprospiraceae bacterium]HRP41523.1 hypothetical protein [Saprospiraceae bacterium]